MLVSIFLPNNAKEICSYGIERNYQDLLIRRIISVFFQIKPLLHNSREVVSAVTYMSILLLYIFQIFMQSDLYFSFPPIPAPRVLRHGNTVARLLGMQVRIPQGTWKPVCCGCYQVEGPVSG